MNKVNYMLLEGWAFIKAHTGLLAGAVVVLLFALLGRAKFSAAKESFASRAAAIDMEEDILRATAMAAAQTSVRESVTAGTLSEEHKKEAVALQQRAARVHLRKYPKRTTKELLAYLNNE